MLPKVNKPQAKQHRPIALTNVGYKIFMSFIKDKIINHLRNNKLIEELQAGFTPGRRIEDNLFILRYIIEKSFSQGKQLYVIAIDFAKAFDSIDRGALIEALVYYRCDPRIINVVADIYVGDFTNVWTLERWYKFRYIRIY